MNQTNLHYINCGNQFVNATADGINQVQSHSCRRDGQCLCWRGYGHDSWAEACRRAALDAGLWEP